MQLLKSIVIGLGVLILLGLTLLTYGFYQKTQNPGWRLFSSPSPAGDAPSGAPFGASAAKSFGTLDLALPEGCVIAGVRPDGERVYLTIGPGEKLGGKSGRKSSEGATPSCNRVIVVDVVRGRVLGTVKPRP